MTRLFSVEAGPKADHVSPEDAELRLRAGLAGLGVPNLRVPTAEETVYSFDLEANTVSEALQRATTVLRAAYGLDWWANVREVPTGRGVMAPRPTWN